MDNTILLTYFPEGQFWRQWNPKDNDEPTLRCSTKEWWILWNGNFFQLPTTKTEKKRIEAIG